MGGHISRVFPGWQEEELLGAGAFGKVYKVKREVMGHVSYAAVKIIQIPGEQSEVNELLNSGMDSSSIRSYYEDMVRNLMNEIQIMESLKTADNIVSIEDFQVLDNPNKTQWEIYIRMEFLTNLGDYLQNHTMKREDIIRLGVNICSALESCENVNIIHRDIKIDNVFVNEFGSFKLGDFGISKQLEQATSALSKKGTNMYMAPEVYRGQKYGNTVDIYSLGIMLYRLCRKGRFPFLPPVPQPLHPEDYHMATARRLNGENIPMPEEVDARLGEVLCRACAFRAEDRFSSAAEMKRELQSCLKAETFPIPLEPVASDRGRPGTGHEAVSELREPERTSVAFSETTQKIEQGAKQKPEKKKGKKRKGRSRGKGGLGKIIAIIVVVAFVAGGAFCGVSYYRNIQADKENVSAVNRVKDFLDQVTVTNSDMKLVIGRRDQFILLGTLIKKYYADNLSFEKAMEKLRRDVFDSADESLLQYFINDKEDGFVSLSEALSNLIGSEEMKTNLDDLKKAEAQIEKLVIEIQRQGEIKGVSKQELMTLYDMYQKISGKYTKKLMERKDANEMIDENDDFYNKCEECRSMAEGYKKKVK